jgi:hypothetical protein
MLGGMVLEQQQKHDVVGGTNRLCSFDTTWTAYRTTHPTIKSSLPRERVYQVVATIGG